MKKVTFLAALGAFAIGVQAQPFATWGKYREITVNTTSTGANVSSAQSQFPLLVRLTNAHDSTGATILSEALAGGADVRFTDSTGTVALPYEIDTWSATGAAIWVRVPTVAGNGTTKLRVYWGRDGRLSASSGPAVFSSSNLTVHHLGNQTGAVNTGARPNSVKPGTNDAVPVNLTASNKQPAGIIGLADSLQGGGTGHTTGQHFDFGTIPEGTFADNGQATLSMWVKMTSFPGSWVQYFTIGNTEGGPNSGGAGVNSMWFGKQGANGTNRLGAQNITESTNEGMVTSTASNNTALTGTWQYISFSVNGSNHTLYSQGALYASSTSGPVLSSALREANYIGRSTWPDQAVVGVVDEARVSTVARSADWVKLEYETQKANVTAVKFGATQTQTVSAPTAVSYTLDSAVYQLNTAIAANIPNVTNGADSFTVAPALPAGLTLNTQTGVITGTPTALSSLTSYTVTARNSAGSTTKTLKIAVVAAVPGAPGTPTAAYTTPGVMTQVTVTWTAPASDGGAAITSYKAYAVQDTSKNCTTVNGTTLTCNISGLSPTTSYSFKVLATNSTGNGPLSGESSLLVPPTVPAAPPAISGLAGAAIGSITVFWNAPNNGGSPITAYKVVTVQDTTKSCGWTTGELFCTVHGLTGGQAYTFQVRAINAVGEGPWSAVSAPVVAPTEGVSINPGAFVVRMSGSAKPFTFMLPQAAVATTESMTMVVSDVWGRAVWSSTVNPSKHGRELTWNGKTSNGRAVSAGMYIVRVSLTSGGKKVELAEKAVSLKP
jgi:hypothetical protein